MESRLRSALSIIGREALRIVLPAWCIVCARELPWRGRVASCCDPCWNGLPEIGPWRCRSCARPMSAAAAPETDPDWLCITCGADPLPLEWCEAWGEYRGGLERVLHAFKFERHDFLDEPLGRLLEAAVLRHGAPEVDLVVAVPMSRSKERRRGYNQAELLARSLARQLDIRFEPRALVKRVEKQTQSTLARADRAANVRGVFQATERVCERTVLIVDDISTTGETFRSCAAELRKQGATKVFAVAVAKAT